MSVTESKSKIVDLNPMHKISLENGYILDHIFTDRTDSCTTGFIEGKMGTAFADCTEQPETACIILGEYLYLEGSNKSTDFLQATFEYAKDKHLKIITLNETIKALVKEYYGDRYLNTVRYQMDSEIHTDEKILLANIHALPDGFTIVPFDKNIYIQAFENDWSEYFVKNFKNWQDFRQNGLGFAVMHNGRLVSGTSSYSYCQNGYEVVIATDSNFYRNGLAFACASKFILETLRQGKIPYWDCANKMSLALSTKLGYKLLREYEGIYALPVEYPTYQTIQKLSAALNLRNEPSMQDWEFEAADSAKISEMIHYFQNNDLNDNEKCALINLILESYNDYIYEKGYNENYSSAIETIFFDNRILFKKIIDYWTVEEQPLENAFRVSQLIRKIKYQ